MHWVHIAKIGHDGKMLSLSDNPDGSFYDEQTGEKITIDSMHCCLFVFDEEKGVLQVGFRFGGYRADGSFCKSKKYLVDKNKVHWSKAANEQEWEASNMDRFLESVPQLADRIAEFSHANNTAGMLAKMMGVRGNVVSWLTNEDGTELVEPIKQDVGLGVLENQAQVENIPEFTVGELVREGEERIFDQQVYRLREGKTHVTQAQWRPDNDALWEPVGTVEEVSRQRRAIEPPPSEPVTEEPVTEEPVVRREPELPVGNPTPGEDDGFVD